MPKKPKRYSINVDIELLELIRGLAQKEDRAIAQMVRVLLREALEERAGEGVIFSQKLKASLVNWPEKDLQSIGQEAIKILSERLSDLRVDRPILTRTKSLLASRIEEHFSRCKPAWEAMPGGAERLKELSQGAHPTDEEFIVLKSCLPVSDQELINIEKEFSQQNDFSSDHHEECNGNCR